MRDGSTHSVGAGHSAAVDSDGRNTARDKRNLDIVHAVKFRQLLRDALVECMRPAAAAGTVLSRWSGRKGGVLGADEAGDGVGGFLYFGFGVAAEMGCIEEAVLHVVIEESQRDALQR